jgi:predicted HAD superfamily hydrolase
LTGRRLRVTLNWGGTLLQHFLVGSPPDIHSDIPVGSGVLKLALKVTQQQIAVVRNWRQFDANWYLDEYPDVMAAGMDPAYHYVWLGQRIGRRPSRDYDALDQHRFEPGELLRFIEADGGARSHVMQPTDADYRAKPDSAAEFMRVAEADVAECEGRSIAVHAHMYYADLSDEFATYLGQMPCSFDLYVSVPDAVAQSLVLATFSTLPKVDRLDVRITQNRGRDIAPFVVEFGPVLAGYDIVAHIQTKRSLYNKGATDGWRNYILEALFPQSGRLAFTLGALSRGQYGIVYPQTFHLIPCQAHTWLANSGLARIWASRFGVKTIPDGYFDFPAGSMFWARTDAIRPLLEAGLTWDDFPPEEGQTDGTLAHCIERMLGLVPTSQGFQHGVVADRQHPTWSRWRFNQYVDRPSSFPQEMIRDEAIKVVAFDIFDTLLLRHFLNPDYVKTILQKRYASKGIPDFRGLRQRYEGEAREARGGNGDVDIAEIYETIHRCEPQWADIISIDDEVALEISSVHPRPEVVDLLEFAVASGKRVILASDMFLTRDTIETMLRNNGVNGWDKLYLSSEIGVRKDRGDMYPHILSEEGIDPAQLLMIGDNERSDVQIPGDMGIKIVHAMKPASLLRAIPRLETVIPDAGQAASGDQFLFGAIAADSFSALSYPRFSANTMFGPTAESIGYALLGPIVLAFSQWLVATAKERSIDRFYFLAREGKFLKQAYDGWTADLATETESAYLVVSRRAVTVPAITDLADIYAIAASNDFHGETVDTFMVERFGVELSAKNWRQIEERNLWQRQRPLTIMQQNIAQIRPLLDFVAPSILTRAADERTGALSYFTQMGVTGDGHSAIIDVGYGATIQRHLGKLLNTKVDGLYMLANKDAEAWATAAKVVVRGCFDSRAADNSDAPSMMLMRSFLLEKMLSASDEQLMHYAADGTRKFREMQAYVGAGQEAREAVQRGAIRFITDAARFRDTLDPTMTITPKRAQDLFERFVTEQSEDEKHAFAKLALDDFYCGRGVVTE